MKAKLDVLYYAVGGGLGHATRAAAILRQLARRGVAKVLALVNTPTPDPLTREDIPFLRLETRDFAATARQALREHPARVLLVDVFPHGVVGELADLLPTLPGTKLLVYRHLRPQHLPVLRQALPQYQAMLCAEPADVALPIEQVDCCPVLIRDADELLPPVAARARLGVGDERPLVLGVSSGDAAWEADFFALMGKLWRRLALPEHLRLATPRPWPGDPLVIHDAPLLEVLPGVDLVVGASGYNLYHETRACGVPTIFLPQPRGYDDQAWRACGSRVAESPEALESALAALTPRPKTPVAYINGAVTAAEAILRYL